MGGCYSCADPLGQPGGVALAVMEGAVDGHQQSGDRSLAAARVASTPRPGDQRAETRIPEHGRGGAGDAGRAQQLPPPARRPTGKLRWVFEKRGDKPSRRTRILSAVGRDETCLLLAGGMAGDHAPIAPRAVLRERERPRALMSVEATSAS